MARNVEIKARIASVEALSPRALALAGGTPENIQQDDTFFTCTHGRLKLRAFADGSGEVIAYDRPDAAGPKTSDYSITPVADPDALRTTLARALPVLGRVVKRRQLWMIGATRLHLDRVLGLGDFLELEVVLGASQPVEEGMTIARDLLAHLQVEESEWVSGAYLDLLAATTARR